MLADGSLCLLEPFQRLGGPLRQRRGMQKADLVVLRPPADDFFVEVEVRLAKLPHRCRPVSCLVDQDEKRLAKPVNLSRDGKHLLVSLVRQHRRACPTLPKTTTRADRNGLCVSNGTSRSSLAIRGEVEHRHQELEIVADLPFAHSLDRLLFSAQRT